MNKGLFGFLLCQLRKICAGHLPSPGTRWFVGAQRHGSRVYALVGPEGSEIEGTAPFPKRHDGLPPPVTLLHDPTRSKEATFWPNEENTDALDIDAVELLQRLPHLDLRGYRRDA